MRRAFALLLMAGLALAAWPACPAGGPLCPPPCPANNTQCLSYLQASHKAEVCGPELGQPERRRAFLRRLRMRHCCEHAVDRALPEEAFAGGDACRRRLDDLIAADELAARVSCEQADVLRRYDCGQTYSIAHRCHHCKHAYRRWVCSSLVPHYSRAGERVLPCLGVCQDVEQQCPYLIPGDWTNQTVPLTTDAAAAHPTPQYAGEPTFLCLDPNIPETGEQRRRSSRGAEDCCYKYCGSPGRGSGGGGGGSAAEAAEDVCEHCPGRPRRGVATSAAAAATAPRRRTRTNSKVSLLWTAWILTFTQHYHKLLQCLLVLCACSVRTTTHLTLLLLRPHLTVPITWWTKTCNINKRCSGRPCS